jgi:gluconolactonase
MKPKQSLGLCALGWTLASCTPPPAPDGPFTPPPDPPSEPQAQTAPAPAAEPSEAIKAQPAPSGSQAARGDICPGGDYASPPVTDTKAQLLKEGFVFVEGPVWSDQLRGLLFSEMDFTADGSNGPPSRIHLLTAAGALFTFLEASGSNGLAIDEQGLLAATHDNQALSRIDLTSKERQAVVSNIDGKKFNSPNDLTISSNGHVYFTDPDWQLGTRPNQTGMTGVYWVKPDKSITLVDGELKKPNGVALSPDEKTLYVGSVDDVIWSYSLVDGKPGSRKEFAKVEGPDGMAVDCSGNLYATSHGAGKVEILSPSGRKLGSLDVAPKTTNAAFGGPERKTLYITAGSGVYAVQSAVPGYPY